MKFNYPFYLNNTYTVFIKNDRLGLILGQILEDSYRNKTVIIFSTMTQS